MTYDFLFSTACLFSCLKVNNSWWSLWDWPIRVHKKHYSPVHYTINYYIDTDEIPWFFLFTFFPSCAVKILFLSVMCEDIGVAMVTNMISQLQEILKFHCLLCRNFISIYKINRSLHGHLEIWILSSRAESLSQVSEEKEWEILSALEDKILIHAQPCNILYLFNSGGFSKKRMTYMFSVKSVTLEINLQKENLVTVFLGLPKACYYLSLSSFPEK